MSKKTIRLCNYEGHQYDPTHQTPWSDTWVKFHLRRKLVKLGPTLMSWTDYLETCEIAKICGDSVGEPLPLGAWRFHVLHPDDGKGLPTILINEPGCHRANIEAAIGWYLGRTYGVQPNLRFRWTRNRLKLFMTPV